MGITSTLGKHVAVTFTPIAQPRAMPIPFVHYVTITFCIFRPLNAHFSTAPRFHSTAIVPMFVNLRTPRKHAYDAYKIVRFSCGRMIAKAVSD